MNVTPLFPRAAAPRQVSFDRHELNLIMTVYGRMVAAGLWRDYALSLEPDAAVFAAFRRATERPDYQVVKRPALRDRQGAFALLGAAGVVLRRGHELAGVLAPLERQLLRLVEA